MRSIEKKSVSNIRKDIRLRGRENFTAKVCSAQSDEHDDRVNNKSSMKMRIAKVTINRSPKVWRKT
jgi:hypothetical protein